VRAGLDEDRLRNYHKLLRESRRDTLTALDRQKQLAEWKARGRAARERPPVAPGARVPLLSENHQRH
jgi:ribosome biogenesis GTPase